MSDSGKGAMKVITGSLAEPRAYLAYAFAVFWPGRQVPVFQEPDAPQVVPENTPVERLTILIAEGRRELDLQAQELQRNHTRAATLVTLSVGELAFLFTGGKPSLAQGTAPSITFWTAAFVVAMLALLGATAVLTARAEFGGINFTRLPVDTTLSRELAQAYVIAVPIGRETNNARLTVLRDGVFLAVLAAVALIPMILSTPTDKPEAPHLCMWSQVAGHCVPSPVPALNGSPQ